MGEGIGFKRWQDAPEVVKTAEDVEKIAKKYLRYDASEDVDEKSLARKTWQELSNKYWDLLYAILDAQTEPFPQDLTFDEEERLFIDFGFLNDTITPRHQKFDIPSTLSSKTMKGVFQYQFFSDFIRECWATITGNPIPSPVCGASAEERIKDIEGQLAALQEKRDSELRTILSRENNIPRGELENVTADLNKFLITATKVSMRVKEYREAKDDVRQAMSQERFRYNEAERVMNVQLSIAQRDAVEPLGLPELEIFIALHESTRTMARKLIYVLQETEKTLRRAKKITEACAQFSPQMMRKELKNMLAKKKEYMAVPAKIARCEQSLLCPKNPEPTLCGNLSALMEEMSNADMDMFLASRIRMYGIPRVILIPGQGLGTYDWADHTILLPVFPTTSAEKSASYGLGTFRWDSDEDRVLKNSYENIKDNKGKSILEMASSFYKDYFLWLTKETKGYHILPRDTHKAFVLMFAPRKQED